MIGENVIVGTRVGSLGADSSWVIILLTNGPALLKKDKGLNDVGVVEGVLLGVGEGIGSDVILGGGVFVTMVVVALGNGFLCTTTLCSVV